MTATIITRQPAPIGIVTFVYAIDKMLTERKAYKTTVRALNRLNERELDDLGLCRADIEGVARRVSLKA